MDEFHTLADLASKAALQIDNYLLGKNFSDFSAVHGVAKIIHENEINPPYTVFSTNADPIFIVMMSHFFEEYYHQEIKVIRQLSNEMKTLQAELYLVPHQSSVKLKELADACVELSKRSSREYYQSYSRYY